jgi:hypothetical protein
MMSSPFSKDQPTLPTSHQDIKAPIQLLQIIKLLFQTRQELHAQQEMVIAPPQMKNVDTSKLTQD